MMSIGLRRSRSGVANISGTSSAMKPDVLLLAIGFVVKFHRVQALQGGHGFFPGKLRDIFLERARGSLGENPRHLDVPFDFDTIRITTSVVDNQPVFLVLGEVMK